MSVDTEQRITASFKVEGVVSAMSNIPGNTPELVEKVVREELLAFLEDHFEVAAPWVVGHYFDVTVTAKLED